MVVSAQARDYSGQRYGKLIAFRRVEVKRHNAWLWIFRCDCGTEIVRLPSMVGASVKAGHIPSCAGCRPDPSNKMPFGEASRGLLFRRYKRNAVRRGLSFEFVLDQFIERITLPCFYCGCEPSTSVDPSSAINGHILYNGLDRVDNQLGYTEDNTVSCCEYCNRAKGVMTQGEFMCWLRRAACHSFRVKH